MNILLKNISPTEALIQIEGEIGLAEQLQFAPANNSESNENAGAGAQKVATYERFSARLAELTAGGIEKLRVEIRSSGGSVQDAILIHDALAEAAKSGIEVSTHCYGFTASAATIIAQAASAGRRYVASTAMYLIHNASTIFEGNAAQATSTASLLCKTDEQIAAIYALRSGLPAQKFAELMARGGGGGEWLTPAQALQQQLVDSIETLSPITNLAAQVKKILGRLFTDPAYQADPKDNSEVENSTATPIALADAAPTKTQLREDPAIKHSAIKLTQNQNSYTKDASLFRQA